MKDEEKTKGRLINELRLLREHIAKPGTSETELRKTKKAPQASKDDLIHSDRLAFTGRIAANIAHEIRNPLTNVAMSAEQLKKSIKSEDGVVAEYVDMIRQNTERANYLITELLNSARPPKLNMQPYNIHRVLKDVLDSTRTKISSQKVKAIKKLRIAIPPGKAKKS